jgi:hypothetical protein
LPVQKHLKTPWDHSKRVRESPQSQASHSNMYTSAIWAHLIVDQFQLVPLGGWSWRVQPGTPDFLSYIWDPHTQVWYPGILVVRCLAQGYLSLVSIFLVILKDL